MADLRKIVCDHCGKVCREHEHKIIYNWHFCKKCSEELIQMIIDWNGPYIKEAVEKIFYDNQDSIYIN